jgi:hypothetical protein
MMTSDERTEHLDGYMLDTTEFNAVAKGPPTYNWMNLIKLPASKCALMAEAFRYPSWLCGQPHDREPQWFVVEAEG